METTPEQEVILSCLKISFGEMKDVKTKRARSMKPNERYASWQLIHGQDIANLIDGGFTIEKIADSVGCSKGVIENALGAVRHFQVEALRDQDKIDSFRLLELKKSFESTGNLPERIKKWCERNKRKLIGLRRDSKKSTEHLCREIGCPTWVFEGIGKENITERGQDMTEEEKLIAQLKGGYEDAKAKGQGAVLRWAKKTRAKVRKLKKVSEKTDLQLAELVGCSPVVFRHDKRRIV